jgi:quinol monooxygenase YgiN
MTGFVQIIEFTTSRIDEVQAFAEQWRGSHPEMGPSRITMTADRDRPGTFVSIVEFGSYEEAMRNSEDPATTEFAEKMASFCDGPPVFRNLAVRLQEVRMDSGQRSEVRA